MKFPLTTRRLVLAVLWLFFTQTSHAQFERLLHRTHADRYSEIYQLFSTHVHLGDTVQSFKSIANLRSAAVKAGDEALVLEADLLHARMAALIAAHGDRILPPELPALIARSEAAGYVPTLLASRMLLKNWYWQTSKNYELAFEEYLKMYPVLQKGNGKELPEKAYMLTQMGEAYYFFTDYPNAIRFSREALTVEVTRSLRGVHNTARNTIGLSYVKTKSLDSADYYFRKIIENIAIDDYAVWKGIAQGGLGLSAYLRGDYTRAVPLLEANIEQAVKIGDFDQTGKSQTLLSDIFFRQNRIADADKTMQEARRSIRKSGIETPLEHLFQIYGKVYAAKGELSRTTIYLDSANVMKERFQREFNSIQMHRASERSQIQTHKAAMERISAEQQIKTLERNILLILIVLLLVVSLYFYNTYYYRSREKERRVQAQLQKAEQELNFATIQLEEFTRNISEKNQLVEELSTRYGINVSEETRQELQKLTILTDEQWEQFRELFEKIHSGYLNRLREKLPGLTPAETRFMALAKLNLNNKEMANTLGISVQSVRVIRHRIRKKLNLPDEADLNDVIGTI